MRSPHHRLVWRARPSACRRKRRIVPIKIPKDEERHAAARGHRITNQERIVCGTSLRRRADYASAKTANCVAVALPKLTGAVAHDQLCHARVEQHRQPDAPRRIVGESHRRAGRDSDRQRRRHTNDSAEAACSLENEEDWISAAWRRARFREDRERRGVASDRAFY